MNVKILLVEDCIESQMIYVAILRASGYEVVTAIDGVEALGYLSTHALPDLIITDLDMPRMNGEQLVVRLKQFPNMPPTILLSANERVRHIAEEHHVIGLVKGEHYQPVLNAVATTLSKPIH